MAVKIKEHGIGIAIKKGKSKLFVELTMIGKLTHDDYQVFVPMIDKALKEAKGLDTKLLIDMRNFKGWEIRASWDDLKFGVKHRNDFRKMAIIGDKKWEEISIEMMDHLSKGKMKFFKERDKALEWLLD
ncbi:MAG TPA: STAS/SEC14 domain-containing protein [Epsilonproteobacteria bacterium]|nr:STAS/SEC14 domain-containing protein [Campylobacterota bacterium]HHH37168.1 STAS/SEC14 domain-containing protein [Campylobacterota bacterium]